MRTSHRTVAWIALLGLAVTLLVSLQRRGEDSASARAAAGTPQESDATRTTQRAEPAAASAASIAVAGDETVTQCVQTVRDAADFVTLEHNAASPGQAAESEADHQVAELAAAQRKLEGSREPEYFLVAELLRELASLGQDSPERRASIDAPAQARLQDLGDRALRSGSKLLAWHALRACVAAKQSCPIAHLEQRLLEVDRQNAEAWALVATLRYERGDAAGALAAMQGAARAPAATWYWTETVALVERSLAAQTSMSYVYRLGAAIGVGATAAQTSIASPSRMCKAESAASRAWGEACLAFGELRGKHNKASSAQNVAYSIREQALTALGDREGAAEAAAELARARAELSAMGLEPASTMQRLQWALLETAPQQLHAYLGAIQQYGEVAGARMFLRQEVPPLLERAALLQRQGARECFAQFFAGSRAVTDGQRAQVADELYVAMRSPSQGGQRIIRIRPDGRITVPFVPGTRTPNGKVVRTEREIVAAGKTTAQLQREIATTLSEYHRSPEVVLTLFSPGSREDLLVEFDKALREAAERRSSAR